MGMQGIHEVGGISQVCVADSKVINHQGKAEIMSVVLPQAGGVWAWMVAMRE